MTRFLVPILMLGHLAHIIFFICHSIQPIVAIILSVQQDGTCSKKKPVYDLWAKVLAHMHAQCTVLQAENDTRAACLNIGVS